MNKQPKGYQDCCLMDEGTSCVFVTKPGGALFMHRLLGNDAWFLSSGMHTTRVAKLCFFYAMCRTVNEMADGQDIWQTVCRENFTASAP